MELFSKRQLFEMHPLMSHDVDLMHRYDKYVICGADEVGRGALAGPICAAAVVLTPATIDIEIKDSKRFSSRTKRSLAAGQIMDLAEHVSIALVGASEIDRIGIQEANRRVLIDAISNISIPADKLLAILDGRALWPGQANGISCVWEEQADNISMSVAAASIVAKVHRDEMMFQLAKSHPGYGFDNHVGYGSAEHLQAIRDLGTIPGIHRKTFIHLD